MTGRRQALVAAAVLTVVRSFLALILIGCAAPAPPTPRPRATATTVAVTEVRAEYSDVTPGPAAAPANVEPSKPKSPFAYANSDPSDDYTVGPPDVRPTCNDDLAKAGIKFKPAKLEPFVQPKSKITCGAPQVVIYQGSPAKIGYSPSVMVTCTMALALARFESIMQDEAMRTFGKRVVKVTHVGTYACREMAAYKGWVSEHSYANAIDLTDFTLEDGRTINVLKHFHPGVATTAAKEGTFMRDIARRAFDEDTFSTVLTPFFDKLHANHFHVDLARFRTDGTRG